jgi:iron complex transport system ATP-binding protein
VRKGSRPGAAVVVVLHDLGLAAAYANRAYVLADGRVRSAGPPAEGPTRTAEHPWSCRDG